MKGVNKLLKKHETTIDAMESETGIIDEILKSRPIEDHLYIDYQGNKMRW